MRVRHSLLAATCFALTNGADARTVNNVNVEMAATINVAENICDINFGTGRGGLVHYVMLAAADMRITIDAAAQLADVRAREIMAFIVSNNRTAQFCQNARAGRLR